MHSSVKWENDMAFQAELNGHNFYIDAMEDVGGKNLGPRPKGLVLTALAGCTAMDVIFMLKRKKISPDSFEVKARAKLNKKHPKTFSVITVSYIFEGQGLDLDEIKNAVDLSDTTFCAVTAMLRNSTEVNHEIIVNGEKIN